MKEKIKVYLNKIAAHERVEFYSFLRTLLDSGMRLQTACGIVASTMEDQAAGILFGRKLLKIAGTYRFVEDQLRVGHSLHQALSGRVPENEVMMLMAGAKGKLKDGLAAAERSAKSSSEMKSTFLKGLLYPGGMSIAVVVAMNWIGNNLLQTLIALKALEKWTPAQQKFYWATQNVGTWVPLTIISLVLIGVLVAVINKRVVGDARERIHGIPPLNVIRQITAATLLTTLSSLVLAGETMRGALNRMSESSSSSYMIHYVEMALRNIRIGLAATGPGKALASKLFTPWIIVKLELYSRGNAEHFAVKMAEIADDAQQNAIKSISGISKLVGTAMLAVAAVVIGFTVITMYSITGSMQAGAGM
jgi:type II secretory pathway component PulF